MRIESELGTLEEVDRQSEPGVGPAIVYRLSHPQAKGRIGFISAMSAPFCATCNRLRLTANGILRSCLFEGGEVNLRDILRSRIQPRQSPASDRPGNDRLRPPQARSPQLPRQRTNEPHRRLVARPFLLNHQAPRDDVVQSLLSLGPKHHQKPDQKNPL